MYVRVQLLFYSGADDISVTKNTSYVNLLVKLLDLVNLREKLNANLQFRTSDTLVTVLAVLDAIIEEVCNYVTYVR